MLRIGIDVGGTHTDAVMLDGDDVLSAHKVATSADVVQGVLEALERVLQTQPGIASKVQAVMLGTTQFTNAVVERRELDEVAAVRISLPSGQGLPPLVGWPPDLASCLGHHAYQLPGGYLFDGWALAKSDDALVEQVIADIKAKGLTAAAVSSAFSPMNPEPERQFAARLRQAVPGIHITESHKIGRLGILERENAAILNVSLRAFAERVVGAFTQAVSERGLSCPFYISQNDGTLMGSQFAREFPALTFASGPTNSLRGAAKLTGMEEAIVVDIGGTTSDIGILQGGFPRESNVVIDVGGVRTNFRMPDIIAVGLGGGSIVSPDGSKIGPQSVGHRLTSEGRVFGGSTLTATDIAVAAHGVNIGEAAYVADLSDEIVTRAQRTMVEMVERNIEQIKPNAADIPVILVGGGAVLLQHESLGDATLTQPRYADVANAIGAAIAQIGGESERLVDYEQHPRDAAVADASTEAKRLAVQAGACESTLRITDIEETSLSYMPGVAMRLRVKAVGELRER